MAWLTWVPKMPHGFTHTNQLALSDSLQLDADEEEAQVIGAVMTADGLPHTFGTAGSAVGWLPGAGIVFGAGATLRVGLKQASRIDLSTGPAGRATIGAAAFDVHKALVGGTDTITTTTWRNDLMASGTPFTVTPGDLVAACVHLDITSGSPLGRVRQATVTSAALFPAITLVTSGPTYTNQAQVNNMLLTFDDGVLGWIEPAAIYSVIDAASPTIGSGNIQANIVRFPVAVTVLAMTVAVNPSTNAADFAFDLYSTPLGTPSLVEAMAHDANVLNVVGSARLVTRVFSQGRLLQANTDYAVGVRQTTGTAVSLIQRDVQAAAHFQSTGLGAECYAVNSTGGATFAAVNSGNRRYHIWLLVSPVLAVGGGSSQARVRRRAIGVS